MKLPSKRELQQVAFNHSFDIAFEKFMNFYKKYAAKPYSFLAIHYYFFIRQSFTFQEESFKKNIKTNHDREAAKISALSSGKIDKYEYLTGKEILPSDQIRIIEEAKFTFLL